MKRIVVILVFTCFAQFLIAQREYFFIEVESQDSTSYETKYGKFHANEEKKLVKTKSISYNESQAFEAIMDAVKLSDNEYKDVFIYIHGMWGHQDWYQNDVLNTFEDEIFMESENPAVVISLIWHSGINYWDNAQHAYSVGKYFSNVFDSIIKIPGIRTKVLCHSMGNRVFQGIHSSINNDTCTIPPIAELYMVAADLEENIFNEDQPLNNICHFVNKVFVYVHNNDRSLGMSRSLNENKRLGLDSGKSLCLQDSCLQIIDVSIIQDNEGFGPSLSNHRYFYTSPTVRNDLKLSLAGKENPDRKILNHARRFQLLPLKDQ